LLPFSPEPFASHPLSKNIKIRIYKIIILPVVLHGCKTSPDFEGDHRTRVFENRVLMRLFVQKRDEVTGGRKKLHNEELRNLYSSPSVIRTIQ
jgi:hypothetical protein